MDYKICSKTIMDTSDPDIIFDENGISHHYHKYWEALGKTWFPNEEGRQKLDNLIGKVKEEGKGKEYDVLIGISGGLDSTYLAYILRRDYDLRILAVHVDTGWNSELSVKNIENLVKALDIDLKTYVINWKQMQDLQLAFFKSGVLNQDVPQDHSFYAALLKTAKEHNIKYFLSGHNHATEGIMARTWTTRAADLPNLIDIHKRFGKMSIDDIPKAGLWKTAIYFPIIFGLKTRQPLQLMEYNKNKVLPELERELGWISYKYKHGESRFTSFFQHYYLPKKFNIDKRRAHLSCQILLNDISREEALEEMKVPLFDVHQMGLDFDYMSKKLGISVDELNHIIDQPPVSHNFYKSDEKIYNLLLNTINGLKIKDKIKKRLYVE